MLNWSRGVGLPGTSAEWRALGQRRPSWRQCGSYGSHNQPKKFGAFSDWLRFWDAIYIYLIWPPSPPYIRPPYIRNSSISEIFPGPLKSHTKFPKISLYISEHLSLYQNIFPAPSTTFPYKMNSPYQNAKTQPPHIRMQKNYVRSGLRQPTVHILNVYMWNGNDAVCARLSIAC